MCGLGCQTVRHQSAALVRGSAQAGMEDRIMATANVSTTIKRPVEDVFAVLSNPETSPKWSSSSLESKKISEGPIGVGTTWRSVSKFLGRRIETEMEITEFEPNRKFTLRSMSGPFPLQAAVPFERIEAGTRIRAI